jgi:hypothetical protein
MNQFGFAVPAPGWSNSKIDFTALARWSKYGIWDPIAADVGYLFPGSINTDSSPPPFLGDAEKVYFGQLSAYQGRPVPQGGCAADADRKVIQVVVTPVQGTQKSLSAFVSDLDHEALVLSRQDSRVVPLMEAWRSCMKKSGWDYLDVQAPFDYWSQPPRRGADPHIEPDDISNEEKTSARDDLACKHSTGLLGTWLAADMAYEQRLVDRDGEKLRELVSTQDKILVNANKVIANGGR